MDGCGVVFFIICGVLFMTAGAGLKDINAWWSTTLIVIGFADIFAILLVELAITGLEGIGWK